MVTRHALQTPTREKETTWMRGECKARRRSMALIRGHSHRHCRLRRLPTLRNLNSAGIRVRRDQGVVCELKN